MKSIHRIHYIAQYGENQLKRELTYSPAGLAKMKYIVESLKTLGLPIYVYSTSSGGNVFRKIYCTKTLNQGEKLQIRYCTTFGSKYIILRIFERLLNQMQLLIYLTVKVKRTDLVVVYHEIFYLPVVRIAKSFRKFRLLYQVEEIYTLASNLRKERTEKEKSALMMADAYIFSNDIMAKRCGFDCKPFIVSYGSYQIVPINVNRFQDGKIHVLYAGTFDENKGGAIASIRASEYLPANYHLHVAGFGTERDIQTTLLEIEKIKKKNISTITFEGYLPEWDFSELCQRCDIGLATQDANLKFNDLSFQSKILTYLSHGLNIVTFRLEVLKKSKIDKLLVYCEDNSPKAIAEAITSINVTDRFNRKAAIEELDRGFVHDLHALFREMESM